MESRTNDDIRYSEYFIRKTIQPYSLRTKRLDPKENICFRKNLTLYINKQTAHLRTGKEKQASIRELYQTSNPEGIPIFPTIMPKEEKAAPNHHRSAKSLNLKDPNDWIFKKVENYLQDQKCFDFIYADTPQCLMSNKKEEVEEEKRLPPEEEIDQAILDSIKEKDMTKYFNMFQNKMQLHKLKQFRTHSDMKNIELKTFFTEIKDDHKHKKLSAFGNHEHNDSAFSKIKDILDENEKNIDEQILEEICEENGLNTVNLLGISEFMNEASSSKNVPTSPKEYDDRDVIEVAQEETFRDRKLLSQFKKKNLKPGENVYKTHFKNNELYANEHQSKMKAMRNEAKKLMETVETRGKMKKVESMKSFRNEKLKLIDLEQVQKNMFPELNSPEFANFQDIMGRYSAFTTPAKAKKGPINFESINRREAERISSRREAHLNHNLTPSHSKESLEHHLASSHWHENINKQLIDHDHKQSNRHLRGESQDRTSHRGIQFSPELTHSPSEQETPVIDHYFISEHKHQDKIYIEDDNNEDPTNDTKIVDARNFNNSESPYRRSNILNSASTRYTSSASPLKKNRVVNINQKVAGFFKTVDNFYKTTNEDTKVLKTFIKDTTNQMDQDFVKYTHTKEKPLGTLSPEMGLYKQRRIFRRKLAESIRSKIQNLHVFVNALHNKKRTDSFNPQLMRLTPVPNK